MCAGAYSSRALLVLTVSWVLIEPTGHAYAGESIAATINEVSRGLADQEARGWQGGALAAHFDGDRFLYLPERDRLTIDLVDVRRNTQRRLVSHDVLVDALRSNIEHPEACELIAVPSDDKLSLACTDKLVSFNLSSGKVMLSKSGARERRLAQPQLIDDQFPTTFGPLVEAGSPDGRSFAGVEDHNLYIRNLDGEKRFLTVDGRPRETWRNTQESAQSFNAFWSRDSRTLATLQLDTRDVWHEPLPHLLETPPRTAEVAYPRAGEPMHRFRPFFIDVESGERTAIELGNTENHYVDIVGWRGNDRGLLVHVLDREHRRRRVFSADRLDGASTLILEETAKHYHDSWMTLFIDFVVPLQKSSDFLYLSEASGWRHIFRYGADPEPMALTGGDWPVERIVHVDERHGYVYFLASMNQTRPHSLQLYRTALDHPSEPELLTGGKGRAEVLMSPGADYFIVRTSAPDSAPIVELRRSDGRILRELSRFDVSGLRELGFAGVETIETLDTSGLWTQFITILKPFHFDPGKKYPVIELIYGGMQSFETSHQFFGFGSAGRVSPVARMLMQSGYVVVLVDAPGTPGRGRAYQDILHRRWPQTVIPNHVKAIGDAAADRPWMDIKRLGIYGHSWGSYMAQRAMIEAPEFYRAAVAHNGGSDFVDQPTYIEPFMSLPENNPEGYRVASNLDKVDNIQGPILAFTAPFDVNSGFSPAFKLIDAMMAARKDIELFVPPRSQHRLNCCSPEDELYKLAKILRFFDREVGSQSVSASSGN